MICSICKRNFDSLRSKTYCSGCSTKIRRYRAKEKLVKLHGGKCIRCGWSGPLAGFQFHHRNPAEKEFIIGNVSNRKWELIVAEAEKCDMLCANCHCIEHSNYHKAFLVAVKEYNGRTPL